MMHPIESGITRPHLFEDGRQTLFYAATTATFIALGAYTAHNLGDPPVGDYRLGSGAWMGGAAGALAAYTLFETGWWWR